MVLFNSFTMRKLFFREKGFTLIELLVVIAIIGVLASIVLASLNSARRKSRDSRRVADIKQMQLALELYFDAAVGGSPNYPAASSSLAPTYIPAVPADPLGGAYAYFKCSNTSYHFGASLEESGNVALSNDRDSASLCVGDTVNGTDTGKCVAADLGAYCYDVTP